MKTFRQFFEDTTDVKILAQPEGERPTELGVVDRPQADQISNYVSRVSSKSEAEISKLIQQSKFSTGGDDEKDNKYYQVFDYLLYNPVYDIDWPAFREHVNNRFKTNNLATLFNQDYGQFNLKDDFALPILNKFVRKNVDDFFQKLFVINPAMGGTSVGDGEFILGILGNGVKGDVGDVDVVADNSDGLQIGNSNVTLEVGTQNKIIGESSRSKTYVTVARKLMNAMSAEIGTTVEAKEEIAFQNNQQKWAYIKTLVKDLGVADRDSSLIVNTLRQAAKQDIDVDSEDPANRLPARSTFINRVIGGVVMYKYITDHNDDIIVSINYGEAIQKAPYKPYDVRYAKIRKLGLAGTVNLMTSEGWYDFNISDAGTRFILGSGV